MARYYNPPTRRSVVWHQPLYGELYDRRVRQPRWWRVYDFPGQNGRREWTHREREREREAEREAERVPDNDAARTHSLTRVTTRRPMSALAAKTQLVSQRRRSSRGIQYVGHLYKISKMGKKVRFKSAKKESWREKVAPFSVFSSGLPCGLPPSRLM